MMSPFAQFIVQIALVVMVLLLLPCAYRMWIGPSAADRLQASDTITTLLLGIIVILALLQGTAMFIDVAIAIAAFGFISTLAIARYISQGKGF